MESRTGETGMFTIWDVMGTPHPPIASESSRKILPFFFLFAYGPSTTRGQEEHKTSHHQSQPYATRRETHSKNDLRTVSIRERYRYDVFFVKK